MYWTRKIFSICGICVLNSQDFLSEAGRSNSLRENLLKQLPYLFLFLYGKYYITWKCVFSRFSQGVLSFSPRVFTNQVNWNHAIILLQSLRYAIGISMTCRTHMSQWHVGSTWYLKFCKIIMAWFQFSRVITIRSASTIILPFGTMLKFSFQKNQLWNFWHTKYYYSFLLPYVLSIFPCE